MNWQNTVHKPILWAFCEDGVFTLVMWIWNWNLREFGTTYISTVSPYRSFWPFGQKVYLSTQPQLWGLLIKNLVNLTPQTNNTWGKLIISAFQRYKGLGVADRVLSYQSISWRKRVEVVISLDFEVHIKKIASSKISDSSEIPMYGYGKIPSKQQHNPPQQWHPPMTIMANHQCRRCPP